MGKLKINSEEFENLVKMYTSFDESNVVTAAEIVNKLNFNDNLGEIIIFCFILDNPLELEPDNIFKKHYSKAKIFLVANNVVPVTMSSFRIDIYNFIVESNLCSDVSKKFILDSINKTWSNIFFNAGFKKYFNISITLKNEQENK